MSTAAARPLDGNTSAMPEAAPLARVLESYLAGLEAGRPADPDGLIAAHPELAGPLRAWLTFMHLANSLNESAPAGPFAADPGHARVIAPPDGSALTRRWIRDGSAPHPLRPEPLGRRRARSCRSAAMTCRTRRTEPPRGGTRSWARSPAAAWASSSGPATSTWAATWRLKVLQARHLGDPGVVDRFVEEARISGQLQHPGIVPVHELGTLADHRPYFTMKLVKGRTLEALLAERPSPKADLPRFLTIFEQVCQTVAYAHARRRDPPRPQAGQRDGRLLRRGAGGGLGVRQGLARGWHRRRSQGRGEGGDGRPHDSGVVRRAAAANRSRAACWALRRTWPPSRPGAKSTGSTSGPTCSAWARSSAKSSSAGRRSGDRRERRSRPGPARGDLAKVLRRLDASGADAELDRPGPRLPGRRARAAAAGCR